MSSQSTRRITMSTATLPGAKGGRRRSRWPTRHWQSWHFRQFLAMTFLEVVADPQRELDLAQPVAAAAERRPSRGRIGEHQIFPVAVEQRPPRPVEMDREAERERLEADAVGRAAVDQPEAVTRQSADRTPASGR